TELPTLSDRELVDAIEAARRQATWAQSLMLEGVAELARRRYGHEPYDSDTHRRICGEVSIELTVPTGQAEELVVMADTLPTMLPNTWAALRTGLLDYDRARVMVDGLGTLDPALARQLDADLIGEAIDATKTQLRHRLARAIKQADPAAHAERTRRAKTERRVEVWDNDDDTCDLVGRNLAAADAHAIRNRLTAAAQAMKADGDLRTIDQIRADLHHDLLRGIPLPDAVQHLITDTSGPVNWRLATPATGPTAPVTGPTLPTARTTDRMRLNYDTRGARAGSGTDAAQEVSIVAERVIAEALAEVADQQLTAVFDRARAEGQMDRLARLIGDAAQAMRDALTGTVDTWCRATSQNARHGHPRYRPPAALQRLIQHRHTTCVYPTCNRRSIHCDIDHTQPYDNGGHTCKCNLAPLCRAHHRIIKQHPDWKLIQLWPGLLVWVTPTGIWHIVTPR
ncbi:MAG TPA: DUF222 domain-containing protein, partial [Streptosporangiaceae bacterium]